MIDLERLGGRVAPAELCRRVLSRRGSRLVSASSSASRTSNPGKRLRIVGIEEESGVGEDLGSAGAEELSTGVPHAIASSGGMPKPSYTEGKTKAQAALYSMRSSDSPAGPKRITYFSRPSRSNSVSTVPFRSRFPRPARACAGGKECAAQLSRSLRTAFEVLRGSMVPTQSTNRSGRPRSRQNARNASVSSTGRYPPSTPW